MFREELHMLVFSGLGSPNEFVRSAISLWSSGGIFADNTLRNRLCPRVLTHIKSFQHTLRSTTSATICVTRPVVTLFIRVHTCVC